MAYDEALKRVSYDADASLAQYTGISGMPGAASPNYGHQFAFVKQTGSHTVGLCTAASGERALGVLQNKPQKLGTGCSVALLAGGGTSLVIAGGALAAGDPVKADANGHAVVAASGNTAYGTAVEAAASGAAAPVALSPPFTVA